MHRRAKCHPEGLSQPSVRAVGKYRFADMLADLALRRSGTCDGNGVSETVSASLATHLAPPCQQIGN